MVGRHSEQTLPTCLSFISKSEKTETKLEPQKAYLRHEMLDHSPFKPPTSTGYFPNSSFLNPSLNCLGTSSHLSLSHSLRDTSDQDRATIPAMAREYRRKGFASCLQHPTTHCLRGRISVSEKLLISLPKICRLEPLPSIS